MFAAAKFCMGNINCYSPKEETIDRYGLIFLSEDIDEAREYGRTHRAEFLEMNGHYFPMLISFDPARCPRTMEYLKTSPSLHIAAHEEEKYLSECAIEHIF